MNTLNRTASRRTVRGVAGIVVTAAMLSVLSTSNTAAQAQQQPPPAQTAPVNAPPPGAPPAIQRIPDGTEVRVALDQDLKSGSTKTGSDVHFTITRDVRGMDGVVLIPAGSPAVGHVEQSHGAGFIGKPGKIAFSCDFAVMPDGTHVPLRTDEKSKYGRDNRVASVGAAVVFTPLALLLPGRNEVIKSGTQFTVYVDQTIHG
jgi:hypothetical protein